MDIQVERLNLAYKNCSNKFLEKFSDYSKQYCSVYLTRLENMEVLLLERIQRKWGNKFPICKLHKLTEETYEKCVVIGTLFKNQKLKPSVLKQLAESNQLLPQPIFNHFTDESDVLFMEDEVQRYEIIGNTDAKNLVTGISCAFLGTDIGKGKFQVEECIFGGFRPQTNPPLLNSSAYILFLSDLNFIQQEKCNPNLELLTYWLSGLFGDTATVSKICRVIIAGNSIGNKPAKSKSTISLISRTIESTDSMEAVKSFDNFLLKLCQFVDVDIMPGEFDPTNHILPQKPMHYCMFPEAFQFKSFNPVSNPYFCEIGGFKLMGTSGQNIRDIMRYSEVTDPLKAMENCLKWNHLAPTAPDTLGCFPFHSNDPFIIEECPHVYFVGNQPQFATKMIQGEDDQKVCLLSIPQFSNKFEAVLFDLQNQDSKIVTFETR